MAQEGAPSGVPTTDSPVPTDSTQEQPPRQQGRGSGQGNNQGGRGQSRGGRGRQTNYGGRGPPQHQGRGRGGPTTVAPTSGIPYGHVPGYLPGSSSLVEQLDKRVLVVLRDGRHLVGLLRSFDQFSNMVLDEASERRIHRDAKEGITYFSDVPLGVYIVRGDSMVLLGEISSDQGMKQVESDELDEIIKKSPSEPLEWDFDKDLEA